MNEKEILQSVAKNYTSSSNASFGLFYRDGITMNYDFADYNHSIAPIVCL